MSVETVTDCRVWVTDWALYNEGRLLGEWVEVTEDVEALRDEVQRVTRKYGGPTMEEPLCCDAEGFPRYLVGDLVDCESFCGYVRELEDYLVHGEREEFDAFISNNSLTGEDLAGAGEACKEAFIGSFGDAGQLADHLIDEGIFERPVKPEGHQGLWLGDYIDVDRVGRDLDLGGDVWNDGASWFWSNV